MFKDGSEWICAEVLAGDLLEKGMVKVQYCTLRVHPASSEGNLTQLYYSMIIVATKSKYVVGRVQVTLT